MYKGQDSDRTSQPIIPSTISANAQVERWLRENNITSVTDKAGIAWKLVTQVDNIPDPKDNKGILWQAKIRVLTQIKFSDLLRTGTLEASSDERLGHLMEGRTLTLEAKPLVVVSPTEEGMRREFMDSIQYLRERFRNQRLDEVKRQLVGQWVERRQQFATEK